MHMLHEVVRRMHKARTRKFGHWQADRIHRNHMACSTVWAGTVVLANLNMRLQATRTHTGEEPGRRTVMHPQSRRFRERDGAFVGEARVRQNAAQAKERPNVQTTQ